MRMRTQTEIWLTGLATAFLRNLIMVLVAGFVGLGVLQLPINPWVSGGAYALLLAGLVTWGELIEPP